MESKMKAETNLSKNEAIRLASEIVKAMGEDCESVSIAVVGEVASIEIKRK